MVHWAWLIVAFSVGAFVAAIVVPRLVLLVRSTPPPDLPERFAPGWRAECTRCGRTRTLAGIGGIRLGGYRGAKKATLAWCRGCRRPRWIQLVHEDCEVPPG